MFTCIPGSRLEILQIEVLNNLLQLLGRGVQSVGLLFVEGNLQNLLHTPASHNGGDGQAQAVEAVLSAQAHGHGEHRPLVLDDALGNAGHRHGDAVVGGALALDDLIGAVPHPLVDALGGSGVVVVAPELAEPLQGDAGDVGAAPHRQLAVPVLADDEGVDVAAVHVQVLAQQELQPGGVQHGAGAEHPVGGIAGNLHGGVGEHVHGVGHDHQHALKGAGGDLGDDGLEDAHVLVDEVQAGLAGFLVGPGGDDHQGAVGHVLIGAGVNLHGGEVGQTVAEVHGLALRLVVVGVNEHHLGEQPLLNEAEGDGGAHEAAADDGNLAMIHRYHSFLGMDGEMVKLSVAAGGSW